jgi:branched-chain amino acid transport system ATP-binding protein
MAEPLLRIERLSRRFGGLLAIDAVSLVVAAGRITGLIGPNGAGKTTLFAIVSGFLPPSEGRVFYRGVDITGMPPHLLARRGIARTFQIVQPFAGLSVRENIAIGAHLRRRRRADALAAATEVAHAIGLAELLDRPAASLTVAGRKRLEVARALATEPELLLLDEVLAGLNPVEVAAMVPMIRALSQRGITILMIEHVMQAVMSLAQQVLVLAQGRLIAEGSPQTVVGDPRVIEAYLGHGAAARLAPASATMAGTND